MSFLAPLGLLLGLLSIPLVALYFLKIRRARVTVPSLLLWHELARHEKLASPFERFRRNLLLLLQLLLLLLLALALARPYLADDVAPTRAVVLVLDATASMGATDGHPTRFDDARAAAREAIDGMGTSDEAMLVVAGAKTDVRVPFTRDAARLRAALDAVAVTDAEGSLVEAVELALSLARSRPGVDVLVLSDGAGEDLSGVPVGDAIVRRVNVGRADRNVGIVALDLRRAPADDRSRQLFVTVQGFAAEPLPATVEVWLADRMVGLRTETVTAEAPVSMVFDLPPGASGVVRVALDAPGDVLDADDEAFAVVEPAAARKLLLVGVDRLTTRVLAADDRFELSVIAADAFTPAAMDGMDAAVFGRPPPVGADGGAGLDGRSYAMLGPFPGGPARFAEAIDGPRLLGWRRTHPTQRFVEWDGVIVARARRVVDGGGLQPIVDADTGPLVLAGERAGARVVTLAFDPLESDLPLRVAWPVFVLNTVGWLTEGAGEAEAARLIRAGAPFLRRLPPGTDPATVSARGPDGAAVEARVDGDVLRVTDTSRAGVYRVRAGGVEAAFAANLLSAKESRVAPSPMTFGAGSESRAVASVAGRRELWRPLLWVAVGVLCVEWVVWNRRRTA